MFVVSEGVAAGMAAFVGTAAYVGPPKRGMFRKQQAGHDLA